MSISVYASNALDEGTQSSGSIDSFGPLPNGAAVWVAITRADAHSTGAVTSVTDDASPSNNYVFQMYIDNGGSEPEIELWVADNITGSPTTIFWSAESSADTSIAVVVFQGQATPSVESLGTGGALPSDGSTDFLSDDATTANVDDYLVLLAGVDAQSNSISWSGDTVTPTAFTAGSGDSAIAFALAPAGATGSLNAEIAGDSSASGPTWVYFAAAVAVAAGPPAVTVTASGAPLGGIVPLTVAFTASASGGTGPYTYEWDFGDGGTSTEQNPSHTYVSPGTFAASCTATDSLSNTGTSPDVDVTATGAVVGFSVGTGVDVLLLLLGTAPLVASASGTPLAGEIPLEVDFTGGATGGSPPYTWAWTFGDGGTSTEQSPTHTYTVPGVYTAQLVVTDSNLNTANAPPITVTVTTDLAAAPTATPSAGLAPLTVAFEANASGGTTPYTYAWNFGDGDTSTSENPSHTYDYAASYVVTLVVTDDVGDTVTKILSVTASSLATGVVLLSKRVRFG
jgi:PKD repeat protein